MNQEEARVRDELAALYRLVAHFRMTDLIDTHISARVPGDKPHLDRKSTRLNSSH